MEVRSIMKGRGSMAKAKRVVAVSLACMMLFGTGVYASQQGLYQTVMDRLMSLKNTYISKDSQLVQDGVNAQTDLATYVEGVEGDFKNELDQYEREQVEGAKQQIQNRVNEIKSMVEAEKEKTLKEIKDEIKNKVDKDLEKELMQLEKAIQKNH